MLMKIKREDSTPVCGRKTFKFLARMTRSAKSSTYKRFESDAKEKKKSKKLDEKKAEEFSKGKENKIYPNKEVKEKKSKKGWKRVRQAALASCRYIGMGAALMGPATVYPSPDYSIDPKQWNMSFSSSYKQPRVYPQAPHWTSNLMYSGW